MHLTHFPKGRRHDLPQPAEGRPDEARRKRTIAWVVGLATLGLIFDGYDLVVYGTVVSTFLRTRTRSGR